MGLCIDVSLDDFELSYQGCVACRQSFAVPRQTMNAMTDSSGKIGAGTQSMDWNSASSSPTTWPGQRITRQSRLTVAETQRTCAIAQTLLFAAKILNSIAFGYSTILFAFHHNLADDLTASFSSQLPLLPCAITSTQYPSGS